jgi:tetratricopeptide (TPR) repeat protein
MKTLKGLLFLVFIGVFLITSNSVLFSQESLTASDYAMMGYDLIGISEWDLAIEFFTKTIELDPNESLTYFMRGMAYQEKDELELAITDFEMAVKINLDNDSYKEALSEVRQKL